MAVSTQGWGCSFLLPKRRSPWRGGILAGAGAVAGAILWWLLDPNLRVHWRQPAELAARSQGSGSDADGDGLETILELVLGTDPDKLDTDGDGYFDSEELARGSSPLQVHSVPTESAPRVGMATYSFDGGPIHPVAAMYCPSGDFANKDLQIGARVGTNLLPLSPSLWSGNSTLVTLPTADGGAVRVLDWQVNGTYVHRFGSLSFYAQLLQRGTTIGVGVTNLASFSDTIVELLYYEPGVIPDPDSLNLSSEPGTGLYRPVDPLEPPAEWIPGAICSQSVLPTGLVGLTSTYTVVGAACEPGWDAYCSPGCSLTVGDTLYRLDPAVLMGG